MNSFFSLLESRAEHAGTLLCVGLDPHPADLPQQSAAAALEFCRRLVDETAEYAAAFKPNAAFFELYGAEGWAALQQLIEHIREISPTDGPRIPVLLDAKRGDIASTAAAYARAIFDGLGADSVTLNPYLGADSVTPFLETDEKGVFLLCKTSNPGAADLQDLQVQGGTGNPAPLYIRVAQLAQRLNTAGNAGLVVGATQLDALARVRETAPDLWFLAPGVGAQGGDLDAALQAGLRADGMGMLVPVSRGIARADSPRRAAADLRDAIEEVRRKMAAAAPAARPVMKAEKRRLADALLDLGCVRFGRFTLKSGIESPFYIDLRRLVADPAVLAMVAEAFAPVLAPLTFDRIAALPYAALPIGTAVSLHTGQPMIYPRKETKEYGTKAAIEGLFAQGDRAVVIDDLITTGGSKFEGIDKLTDAGLRVEDVVVLIDRSTGDAAAELANRGVRLHAVFNLAELLDYWERSGRVAPAEVKEVRGFLVNG